MRKNLLLASLLFAGGLFTMNAQTTVLTEGFQEGTFPPTGWELIQNNNAQTWSVIPSATDPSNYVAQVQYDEALGQQDEWLITPSLDLSSFEEVTLAFELGMSYYWGVDPNDHYDAVVHVSVDGGATWEEIWDENVLGVFENWIMNSVSVDVSEYNSSDVKFAFQYFGADGAQLLVDNVMVTGTGEASINSHLAGSFSVYPNPVKDMLNISNSIGTEINAVTVTDINGRTVKQVTANGVESQINIADLNAGVYFVNINSNQGSLTKKIVKQ